MNASPLDDFRALARAQRPADAEAAAATAAREASLTKPAGSLGRLEALTLWLAGVTGRAPPRIDNPRVVVFASSHGVAERGVSAYPTSVNRQMLDGFRAGTAAINQICTAGGIGLTAFDLAVDVPTGDIAREAAFASERDLAGTLAFGLEAIAGGVDCLALGEMGIANTTVAAALYGALWGGRGADWVGPGTGLSAEGMAHKAAVVDEALARVAGVTDPLDLLRELGGRDVAAMVGAILAARTEGVPVVVDGFVASAAAAIAHALSPDAIDHCVFAHRSAEPAHGRVLERLGADPLLDLGMRLGEGTGAALAIGILRAAVACHAGMATFAQAGVDGPR